MLRTLNVYSAYSEGFCFTILSLIVLLMLHWTQHFTNACTIHFAHLMDTGSNAAPTNAPPLDAVTLNEPNVNDNNAASLLKRTEGLVTLVVSNPGKKDKDKDSSPVPQDGKSLDPSKASGQPSRPATPVPEPPADPATCPIVPGRDTTIEIQTENKGLGIFFVGGKDTQVPNGIIVVEVYQGGMADKDSRLQPGDQLLDINGTALKDVTHTTALQAVRQTLPKMKMIVHRPENIEYTTIDVELMKKAGKGLGLSIVAKKSGKGVYIADILSGSIADVDGKLAKGDLLISVNGQSVENSSGEEVGIVLKTVTGKVSLKVHRYKPAVR